MLPGPQTIKINKIINIPINHRWLFSDSKIENILINYKEKPFTNKSNIFFFRVFVLKVFFIYLLSFFRVTGFYFKQFFFKTNKVDVVNTLILSVGRGYDSTSIYKNFEIDQKSTIVINAFNISDYMNIKKISIFALIIGLIYSIRDYHKAIKRNKVSSEVLDLVLDKGVSNLSWYTYLESFFFEFKKVHPDCVVYSNGATLASHASTISGLKTVRMYHGLMSKICFNTIPTYHSIYVYSKDEKEYLDSSSIKSEICLYPTKKINNLNRAVLIMSNGTSIAKKDELVSLVRMFRLLNYKIYIKLHPLNDVNNDFKKVYDTSPDDIEGMLDMSNIDGIYKGSHNNASDIILKLRPKFLLAWGGSTSICESLKMGVIPINIGVPYANLVYPIHKRSLMMPYDIKTLKGLLSGNISYSDTLDQLQNG
jgi:hypothetical protein